MEAFTWHEALWDARLFPWQDQHGPEEAVRPAARLLIPAHGRAVERLRVRLMEYELVSQTMPQALVVKGEESLNWLPSAVPIAEQVLEEVVPAPLVRHSVWAVCNQLTAALLAGGGEPERIKRQQIPDQGNNNRCPGCGGCCEMDGVQACKDEGCFAEESGISPVG